MADEYEETGTIWVGYAAGSNISFRGKIDTGITYADWDLMNQEDEDGLLSDIVWSLVDMWVING